MSSDQHALREFAEDGNIYKRPLEWKPNNGSTALMSKDVLGNQQFMIEEVDHVEFVIQPAPKKRSPSAPLQDAYLSAIRMNEAMFTQGRSTSQTESLLEFKSAREDYFSKVTPTLVLDLMREAGYDV